MEIKVTQLQMKMMKTNVVLGTGKSEATSRHLSTLKDLSSEVNRMRLDVEAAKLVAKEEITALQNGTIGSTQNWKRQTAMSKG